MKALFFLLLGCTGGDTVGKNRCTVLEIRLCYKQPQIYTFVNICVHTHVLCVRTYICSAILP